MAHLIAVLGSGADAMWESRHETMLCIYDTDSAVFCRSPRVMLDIVVTVIVDCMCLRGLVNALVFPSFFL